MGMKEKTASFLAAAAVAGLISGIATPHNASAAQGEVVHNSEKDGCATCGKNKGKKECHEGDKDCHDKDHHGDDKHGEHEEE